MKKKTIRTFLLTLLLTLMVSMTVFAEEAQQTMYATTSVNVRAGDSASTQKLGSLTKGQAIMVTGEKTASGWYPVDYNGQTGYVSGKYLTATAAVQSATKPIETTPVNNEAATSTSVAQGTTKTFSNGEVFVVDGQTPNGLTIWCMQNDDGTWPDYMIAAYDACGVTDDMSDYDKAVAINNYICSVVDYAYENGVDDRALYSACLTYGKAVCVGYSHAFDCLCTMAGVYSNQVVGGGADGGAHAWNYVLIGDTKYWVDVTYNDANNNAYLMHTSPFADHEFGYEK